MNDSDSIRGSITITLSLSCGRSCDLARGKEPQIYTFHLHSPYVGSDFVVNHLYPELAPLLDQATKKIRAWEYRAQKAAEKQSEIHKRPGT